jgi:hypothetical protein
MLEELKKNPGATFSSPAGLRLTLLPRSEAVVNKQVDFGYLVKTIPNDEVHRKFHVLHNKLY